MKNVNILNILKYFCLLANTLEVNVLLNQYVTQSKTKAQNIFHYEDFENSDFRDP